MTTTQTSLNRSSASTGGRLVQNLGATARDGAPGRTAAAFDLQAFSQALTDRDLDYQLTCYAADADIRIVDAGNPLAAPSLVHGTTAILVWLRDFAAGALGPEVTHVVDGGDRVAVTERWHHHDGTVVQATSTAELSGGLITVQHTILSRSGARADRSAGRGLSKGTPQPAPTAPSTSAPPPDVLLRPGPGWLAT